MIYFIEYAALCSHVYTPERMNILSIQIRELYTGNLLHRSEILQEINWYRLPDVDLTMQTHNPFFAQLYVKFEQGHAVDAVMAIRGTIISNLNNDAVDLVSFESDVLDDGGHDVVPVYLNEAIQFYNKCQAYLSRYFPHLTQIKLTGHSLGGAIAQLMPLLAGYATPAIVFNSPGCGHVPKVKMDQAGWIYNINSRYGFINKIGLTLGHLYLVDVPNMQVQAKAFFAAFDKQAYVESVADFKRVSSDKAVTSKIIDTLKARGYRYIAYFSGLDGATQNPAAQNAFTKALSSANTNILLNPVSAVSTRVVDGVEFATVLYAQHSMDNLLAALYLEQNLKVAMISV